MLCSPRHADEEQHIERAYLHKTDGTERIATIREQMQRTMETGCGIYRERESLLQSAEKIHELKERAISLQIDDHARTFNTQLTSAL